MTQRVPKIKLIKRLSISLVSLGVLISLGFIPIASFSFAPGDALRVKNQIHMKDGKKLTHQGSVYMTDVVVTQLSPITWMLDHFKPEVNIYPASALFGSSIPSNISQDQINEMLASKTAAVLAAFNFAHMNYSTIAGVQIVATGPQTSTEIKPGDVIVDIDGIRTLNVAEAANAIKVAPKIVKMTIVRQAGAIGAIKEVHALVKKYYANGKNLLGITIETGLVVKLPNPISISTGQIGGPSAGLAFSLGILQTLGVLYIKGTAALGATGTIAPNGAVGDVGGVRQKAIAVARAGARYFLVPPQEYQAALSAGEPSLHVVAVSSLTEAIRFVEHHSLGAVNLHYST